MTRASPGSTAARSAMADRAAANWIEAGVPRYGNRGSRRGLVPHRRLTVRLSSWEAAALCCFCGGCRTSRRRAPFVVGSLHRRAPRGEQQIATPRLLVVFGAVLGIPLELRTTAETRCIRSPWTSSTSPGPQLASTRRVRGHCAPCRRIEHFIARLHAAGAEHGWRQPHGAPMRSSRRVRELRRRRVNARDDAGGVEPRAAPA